MAAGLRLAGLRRALAGPFDLAISGGECVAVTGPSGSGKSLMLRMIADLDPHDGEAWLDEVACSSTPPPVWRRRVAYVAAETGWWAEDVAPHFDDLAATRALAADMGLKVELLDGPLLRLSTGERQRLALMRALLNNPSVLLLDEPTGALDEAATARVEAVLRRNLTSGTAILLVTHNPAQAARMAERRYVMRAGKLEA